MIESKKVVTAIAAHEQWKSRIQDAIVHGTSEYKPEIVATNNSCELGKWLLADTQVAQDPNFPKIQSLHNEFHKEAGRILAMALQGKSAEAEKLLEHGAKFDRLSSDLKAILRSLIPFP